jgi:hypothetical protein
MTAPARLVPALPLVPPVSHRPIPALTAAEVDRFRSKQACGTFGPQGRCTVVWNGSPSDWSAGGYGRFCLWRGGKRIRIMSHRLAYFLATGADPGASLVRHGCDFPPCNTPGCLALGDWRANVADMFARRRAHTAGLRPYRVAARIAQEAADTGADSKMCIRCGHVKSLEKEFGRNPVNPDGREWWCAACVSAVTFASQCRSAR